MNFSEFKKLLGADPGNREPETLRARASGPEFEQAAQEAEAFERRLESAAKLPVDPEGAEGGQGQQHQQGLSEQSRAAAAGSGRPGGARGDGSRCAFQASPPATAPEPSRRRTSSSSVSTFAARRETRWPQPSAETLSNVSSSAR